MIHIFSSFTCVIFKKFHTICHLPLVSEVCFNTLHLPTAKKQFSLFFFKNEECKSPLASLIFNIDESNVLMWQHYNTQYNRQSATRTHVWEVNIRNIFTTFLINLTIRKSPSCIKRVHKCAGGKSLNRKRFSRCQLLTWRGSFTFYTLFLRREEWRLWCWL